MPYKIKATDGFGVRNLDKKSWKSKGTTRAKAEAQANLLRGVEHGWRPTGKAARGSRKRKVSAPRSKVKRRGRKVPGSFMGQYL